MKIGYVGLGKMGLNMVFHLLEQGVEVVAWNRSQEPLNEAVSSGAVKSDSIEDLVSKLYSPRIIWLMLPSGSVTDEFIDKLATLLNEGDLIIDGGNSFYKDTLKRAEKLLQSGIHFMDVGVSGGPTGARNGACLMVGASKEDYQTVEDLLIKIAKKDALAHMGKIGSGHFAKMVHNGIEYGMMESIAEGAEVLRSSDFDFNLSEVFRVYNTGSVIESRLVGWAQESLKEDQNLSEVSSKIDATGEGEWTVKTAKELGVNTPVIEESFSIRQRSTAESGNFANKVVSALRGKFGGHRVKDI